MQLLESTVDHLQAVTFTKTNSNLDTIEWITSFGDLSPAAFFG